MSQPRVLVTGAHGFVGAAVARAFRDAGGQVVGVDVRAAPGVVQADLTSESQVARLFESGFDVVAHLAASGIGAAGLLASARADPMRAVEVNIAASARLLTHARQAGVRRFVYASSTTVYGPASQYGEGRVTESAGLAPATVYGATKAAAEHLGRAMTADSAMDFTALRLPLVYGPQRWYGGALAPLLEFLEVARAGKQVTATLDASPTDWLHARDAAQAFTAVAQAPQPAGVYHLVGHTGSMLELAQRAVELIGAHRRVADGVTDRVADRVALTAAPAAGGSGPPLLDDTLARRDLGFAPVYADAESAASNI
ncbi:MAG: NAD-dependent epimerase/dehydratase family protein [Micromonosporaceae bacterium]